MSRAIWITGRPDRGKTTLAVSVAEAVQPWPVPLMVLDPAAAVEAAPDIALDYEASLPPERRLCTHTPDFRSTVEDALLPARRLHRAAAATVTQAEREVP